MSRIHPLSFSRRYTSGMHNCVMPTLAFLTGSVLLASSASPVVAQTVGDGDGDGVADGLDSFPCDATVSSQQVIPALNQSSTLFLRINGLQQAILISTTL